MHIDIRMPPVHPVGTENRRKIRLFSIDWYKNRSFRPKEGIDVRKQDIVEAMELSGLAYQKVPPRFEDELLTIIDARNDVQCYVRRCENSLYITFRGSDSLTDWKHDLSFWKMEIPYDNTSSKIRVHSGFLRGYKCPAVRDRIQRLIDGSVRHIRVMGHSYGAALAILCAIDLEYHFPDKDFEVLVFGCPRVGNRAFKKSYNSRVFKTIRVENGNDIVTKVPAASWGFRHVGGRIHVGFPRLFGWISFNDHRPERYYANILAQLLP